MNRLQKCIVKDALDEMEKLNEWEREFINNLADFSDDAELTEKQNKKLNEISQKIL